MITPEPESLPFFKSPLLALKPASFRAPRHCGLAWPRVPRVNVLITVRDLRPALSPRYFRSFFCSLLMALTT